MMMLEDGACVVGINTVNCCHCCVLLGTYIFFDRLLSNDRQRKVDFLIKQVSLNPDIALAISLSVDYIIHYFLADSIHEECYSWH